MKAIFKKGTKNNFYGYSGDHVVDLKLVNGTWYQFNEGRWELHLGEILIVNEL